jgi:hypothetical protein
MNFVSLRKKMATVRMYLTYIYVSRDADRNPSAVQAFPFSVTLGPEGKGVWEIIEFM